MQKQLITFPDGTSRYVPAKLRIGAAKDERTSIDLSWKQFNYDPEPDRYRGPSVIVHSPSGNYREIGGIESAASLAARNYGLEATA